MRRHRLEVEADWTRRGGEQTASNARRREAQACSTPKSASGASLGQAVIVGDWLPASARAGHGTRDWTNCEILGVCRYQTQSSGGEAEMSRVQRLAGRSAAPQGAAVRRAVSDQACHMSHGTSCRCTRQSPIIAPLITGPRGSEAVSVRPLFTFLPAPSCPRRAPTSPRDYLHRHLRCRRLVLPAMARISWPVVAIALGAAALANAHQHPFHGHDHSDPNHMEQVHGVYRDLWPGGMNPMPLVPAELLQDKIAAYTSAHSHGPVQPAPYPAQYSEDETPLTTPAGDSLMAGIATYAHLPYGACFSPWTHILPDNEDLIYEVQSGSNFDIAFVGMPFDTATRYVRCSIVSISVSDLLLASALVHASVPMVFARGASA